MLPQSSPTGTAKPGRVPHARHRPEETLLYRIVEQHYPAFLDHLETEGRGLPRHVRREFESYLKCGRLEHGFLRLHCKDCHSGDRLVALSCKLRGFCPSCAARRMVDSAALLVDEVLPARPLRQWVLTLPVPLRYLCANDSHTMGALLGIAYRAISTCLIKQAGRNCTNAKCGAITLIQRFGGGLNLNIHFHMLFLDGVYTREGNGPFTFQRLDPPDPCQVQKLLERISRRIGRWLEQRGMLERDAEDTHLTLTHSDDSALPDLQAHSLTYNIALGPHRGRKAFTLQTLFPPERPQPEYPVARTASFSLHAGLVIEENQRGKLEHLCRYIARPPLCLTRLSLTSSGTLCYRLKNPWKNGTTDLLFDPLDFLSRLAALVPTRRTHLTRYHGVFAPHSALRAHITPSGRGSRPVGPMIPGTPGTPSTDEKHRPMSWAQRLKRVFSIDVSTCEQCNGAMHFLGYIGNPIILQRILIHRRQTIDVDPDGQDLTHQSQGPPRSNMH